MAKRAIARNYLFPGGIEMQSARRCKQLSRALDKRHRLESIAQQSATVPLALFISATSTPYQHTLFVSGNRERGSTLRKWPYQKFGFYNFRLFYNSRNHGLTHD